jgi:hypothetical protein
MTPHPYQAASIKQLTKILSESGVAADASDTGTGKTLVAVEVEKVLDLPTLIVCPKPVIPGWERTAKSQGAEFDVINYEMLRTGRTKYGYWKVPPGMRKPRFFFADGVRSVFFDEAHRCMTPDSKNASMMRAIRRQHLRGMAISATLADTPLEMDALGYILGLHDSDENPTVNNPDPVCFWRWAQRHGCGKGVFSSMEFHGDEAQKKKEMAKINKLIFPDKGVRVRVSELGDQFPETQITAELYDLDASGRIEDLYREMDHAIQTLHDHHDELALKRLEKARAGGFQGDFLPDDPLIKLLIARQEFELLFVPILVELTKDDIASGLSVALFVNFRQTLQELCRRLETTCYADGTQTGPRGAIEREYNRLAFQNDESRVIACIAEAGGVGWDLHDIRGKHPRMSRICPGYNAKLLRQVFGRVWRAGGKSKSFQRVILPNTTCGRQIHKKLSSKLDRLDALQDGDLMPDNLILC